MAATRLRAPLVPLLVLLPLLAGCWLDSSTTRHDGTITITAPLATVDPAVGQGIVRLLNDVDTTVPTLHDAGLDGRVAAALVAERQGPDALDGTKDDLPFDRLEDVYLVDGVDQPAVELLGDVALAADLVPVRAIEDVLFSAKELEDCLDLVNLGAEDELEDVLDQRSLNSILFARPFDAMTDVAEAPHVGPAALLNLRDAAARFAEEEAV